MLTKGRGHLKISKDPTGNQTCDLFLGSVPQYFHMYIVKAALGEELLNSY